MTRGCLVQFNVVSDGDGAAVLHEASIDCGRRSDEACELFDRGQLQSAQLLCLGTIVMML